LIGVAKTFENEELTISNELHIIHILYWDGVGCEVDGETELLCGSDLEYVSSVKLSFR
jgi:hypothetical protein